LALAVLDRASGGELSLSSLYLVPVGLAAWLAGRSAGIGTALWAIAVWGVTDVQAHRYAWTFSPYVNAVVRLGVLLMLVYGFDELRRALLFARTDSLTGLPNGRAFRDAVSTEIERARRYERPFTLAYIDVDGFNEVNDQHGHTSGDDLLMLIARTLGSSVRRSDLAARLGGDEFAVLLPETDVEAGRRAAKKVHEALSVAVSPTRWNVTFSMGVVTFIRPPRAVEQALHVADTVMYNVKHQGRNRILYMTSGEAA
jgi:diguanylate cyclase (GGDEF)-like protein